MRTLIQILARLRRETDGNILPIAAMGAIVAAIIVGSAVDLSRAYRVKNQLQAACDAAVLAGRRTVTTNGFDTASKNAADNYFETNFNGNTQEAHSTSFVPSSDDNGNTVKGTAQTTLDTAIMRLFGFNNFALTATCSSSMGVGNSDVVMVLDNTGSMGTNLTYTQTRLEALQAAMKNFYTTLSNATSGTNARIRYGFVPYSTTVNVGQLLYNLNPNYLADSHTYSSRQATYIDYGSASGSAGSPTYQNYQTTYWNYYDGTRYRSWSDCTAAVPADDSAYSDYGSPSSTTTKSTNSSGDLVVEITTTQEQRKGTYQCYYYSNNKYYVIVQYDTRDKVTTTTKTGATYTTTPSSTTVFDHWDYLPISYDTSVFKTFAATTSNTGDSGAAVSATWNGCIHERKTVAQSSFSYSPSTGISPSGAYDLDIDSAPDTYDEDTKWAPMWPEIVYDRYVTGTDWRGRTTYTMTTGTGDYGERVSSPCPAAAQGLQEMTQSQFDTYANSLAATGNTYLDIGMIWGGRLLSPDGIFSSTVNSPPANGGEVSRHIVFMTDGVMEPNNSINQAWGLERWDRKVTSDGSSEDTSRHTSRFLAACEAIKDKGIRIWVIAFTSGLSDDLKTCASDDSSFTASDSTDLNAAFQEIAKQVGELRITN
ncbi:pilus assembly protein TadG-related protein [Novosphingobium malaysiense]|uniref:Pilus assembly protein TadG n=1 Tax=Novosphingobium malaysiense TaxID=1348853 RepID=A0A0B1ZL12_9SPHN|nr:pilus assembly protein TadG-related protein [Novosphingobium malaysiense]KHK91790.1 pilus assembly protein TadG [Novosphingobium malaysiense]